MGRRYPRGAARLDLLLVPSTGPEATTRVIPEAYVAGVPVIAFPSGGIPEVAAGLPACCGLGGADGGDGDRAPDGSGGKTGAAVRSGKRTVACAFTLERYHQEVLATIEWAREAPPRAN